MSQFSINSRLNRLKKVTDSITKKTRLETFPDITIPISDEDIYVPVTKTLSLYKLSYEVYDDPTLWWVIALANNMKTPYDFTEAPTLRVPAYKDDILSRIG